MQFVQPPADRRASGTACVRRRKGERDRGCRSPRCRWATGDGSCSPSKDLPAKSQVPHTSQVQTWTLFPVVARSLSHSSETLML
jgi:hypothetical protein